MNRDNITMQELMLFLNKMPNLIRDCKVTSIGSVHGWVQRVENPYMLHLQSHDGKTYHYPIPSLSKDADKTPAPFEVGDHTVGPIITK